MSVGVVIGNPNPGGRTTTIGEAVGATIAAARGEESMTYELATVSHDLFTWGDEAVSTMQAEVAGHDVVVFACPTYKASYTGLLKAFVDTYPTDGLAGVRAVPVMVGAAMHHALAPEVHLRPLLVELGASVPTRGLYVLDSSMDELDSIVADWAATALPALG